MSALRERQKTLGEMLTKLKRRLGFLAQGPGSNGNNDVLIDFLQEGHDYVYQKLRPSPARKKTTIRLQPGSHLYDYHNDEDDEDIDPGDVISVWVKVADNMPIELHQGITEIDRSFDTSRQYPTKYDTLNGQIEIWPVPDRQYDMIVEYTAGQPRFEQLQDRPGVPWRLVYLYAVSVGKTHYRHPDAQAAGSAFSSLLLIAQGKQHENRRYVVNAQCGTEETVAATADGYKMRVR